MGYIKIFKNCPCPQENFNIAERSQDNSILLRYFSSKLFTSENVKASQMNAGLSISHTFFNFLLCLGSSKRGPETKSESHGKGIHLEKGLKIVSEWEGRVRQGQRKGQYECVL